MTRRTFGRRVASGWAVLAAVGCNGGAADRRPLEGAVTFGGQPVVYGYIKFEPDRAKGHSGVQGSADIRDGRYKTLPKMGPGVGPHVALVTGYDATATTPGAPALFANFPIPVEITADSREINLDVPAPVKK
jgi:hypothetical protein